MIRAVRARGGTAALLLSLVLAGGAAGCSGTPPGTPPAGPAGPSTAAAPADGGPACADVVARGGDVGTAVRQLVDGSGSRDQVAAAVTELMSSVDAARASSSGAGSEALDAVETAAGDLRSTLQAQPIDLAAVRAAAQEVVTALRDLRPVCATDGAATPTATTTA